MYIVEWTDHEGCQHEREFENPDEARLAADRLKAAYGNATVIYEVEV